MGCSPLAITAISEEFNTPFYWRTLFSSDPQFLTIAQKVIVASRSAMHGWYRKDMRKKIIRAVAVREASRESGKLGRVIKSVLDTQTERFLMTYIRTPEGIILSDEALIHDRCDHKTLQ